MMNKFSSLINEVKTDNNSISIADLSMYVDKLGKKLPTAVQNVLYLTKKYNILDSDSLDEIKNALKTFIPTLLKKYNISSEDFTTLWSTLKELGNNIKLLPQYQSEAERSSFMAGKITIDDITIDLSTPKGRNDAAKMYMPLVYKIVNQYTGKSRLSRQDLMSAALQGFAEAMNNFGVSKNKEDSDKKVTFKTYASYRVQQAILNDINEYGHTLSGTNWYATKKYGADVLDAISLDGLGRNEDGEFQEDHLKALGFETDPLQRDEEKEWNDLYKLLESTFKSRDVNIFYRYFGLHGYKREKSKDIAKDFGMSEGNIRNSVINKMIMFLKKDRSAMEILSNIQDMYNESLMCSLYNAPKDVILETLLNDDMFILLEELNRWNNKNIFRQQLYLAFETLEHDEIDVINNLIQGDFTLLDNNYKRNKKTIIKFLKEMYPTENVAKKSDVSILEYMQDIQNAYQKYAK